MSCLLHWIARLSAIKGKLSRQQVLPQSSTEHGIVGL